MAQQNGPITTSQMVVDDGAIIQVIEQLKIMRDIYVKALDDIIGRAKVLDSSLVKMEGTLEQQQKKVQQVAVEAENLAHKDAEVRAEIESLTAKIAKLEAELEKLRKAKQQSTKTTDAKAKAEERLKFALSEEGKEVELIRQKTNQATTANRNAAKQALATANSVEAQRLKVAALKREWATMDIGTPAFLQKTKELRSANKELMNLEKSVGIYSRGVGGYFKSMAVGIQNFALQMVSVYALIGMVKNGVKTIVEFEQATANLAAILGKSRSEIKGLTDSARSLGATTEWTAAQVVVLQTELAKLGFDDSQIQRMQAPILKFATALEADLGPAAELTGAALRAFRLEASETDRVVGVMAVAANKSAIDFEYLKTAMAIVSPIAASFGFTIEDTAALLGALSDAGFDASMAATATRNILLNLADSSGKLAKSLGSPVRTISELMDGLNKLKERGVSLNETLEMTDKRSVSAFNTFLAGTEHVKELRASLSDVNDELERMHSEQMDTVEGQVKLLNSAWEGLMLSFSGSTGIMKTVVKFFADVVTGINDTLFATDRLVQKLQGVSNEAIQENQKIAAGYVKMWLDAGKSFEEATKKGYADFIAENEIAAANTNQHIAELQGQRDNLKKNPFVLFKDAKLKKINDQLGIAQARLYGILQSRKQISNEFTAGTGAFSEPSENVTRETGRETESERKAREKAEKARQKAAEKAKRQQEQDASARLQLEKKAIENENAAMEKGYDQQVTATINAAKIREQEIQRSYDRIKAKTDEDHKTYAKAMQDNNARLFKELNELQANHEIQQLEWTKKGLEMQLATAQKGSDEYLDIQLKQLQIEEQIALRRNALLPKDQQQNPDLISAGFKEQANRVNSSEQLERFDQQAALKMTQWEIDNTRATEEEKFRIRKQAEIDRWKEILRLNDLYGSKMAPEEIKRIKLLIQQGEYEVERSAKKKRPYNNFLDVIGLKFNGETQEEIRERQEAVMQAVNYTVDQLSSVFAAQEQLAQLAINQSQERIDAARSVLDAEREAAANGYANNVAQAQRELALQKQTQEKLLRQQAQMQRAQQAIEALSQTSSLITASANIWASFTGGTGLAGPFLAAAAIATMWASFAAAQIKAAQVTRQSASAGAVTYGTGGYEYITGGSHQSGRDVSLGRTQDGRERRIEGGEFLGVINKRATRKYGSELGAIIDSINHGEFERIYMRSAFSFEKAGITINQNADTARLAADVAAIRRQGERQIVSDGKGRIFIFKGNNTKIIKS